jgi:transposase InsO family protein
MILKIRDDTHWGARKISWVLSRDYGVTAPRSTVHSVLQRHARIDATEAQKHQAFCRFEHAKPNELWQIDFKGDVPVEDGRCHPFTALDDHSRYSLALAACLDQTTGTVVEVLTKVFLVYGLPWRVTMDNGSPWGDDSTLRLTKFTAWLIRIGIRVSHSRPYHPQTQGKDERFHGSLDRELLRWNTFRSLPELQKAFDRFRHRYNFERPHEALGMQTPAERYVASAREMPSKLPPIEYGPSDHVRKVGETGRISFLGYTIRAGKGCSGLPIAVRPTTSDGVYEIVFCMQTIGRIDLRDADQNRVISTVKPANAPHSPLGDSQRETTD